MKLNESESQDSFRKKTKMPSIQESKSNNYNHSTRLFSSHNYVSKPKPSAIPTTQYNKQLISSSSKNDCSDGKDCPHLHQIQSLISQIAKQKRTIEDLTNLNDFFIYSLSQKDSMYRTLLQESNTIKATNNIGKDKLIFTSQCFTNRPKSVFINPKTKLSSNASSLCNTSPKNQGQKVKDINENQIKFSNCNSSHYDNLMRISNKTTKNNIQNSTVSFLAMSVNMLKKYENNEYVNFLQEITQSEKSFSSMIRGDDDEFASDLCDSIRNIVKDFKQMICLVLRIKLFLKSTHDLVNNMLNKNFNDIVISNASKFLNCEQALLYLYEPISDMLNVFPCDETSRTKVSKTYGIIGHSFTRGESIKIDDTMNDLKSKSDTQRKNIRNILCYPLKTTESEVFGVIEAANKRDYHFNNDDDELMIAFSNLVSVLLKINSRNEEHNRAVVQYERIIKYSIEIQSITNRIEFIERTESLLNLLFYTTNSRVLFVNNLNGQLINKSKAFTPKHNVGIVYYIMKRKECFACWKAKNCQYYNTLIDIDSSESLVTYPVLIDHECVAVMQFVIKEQLDDKREMPKEKEMKILSLIDKCIVNWYKYNKASLFI